MMSESVCYHQYLKSFSFTSLGIQICLVKTEIDIDQESLCADKTPAKVLKLTEHDLVLRDTLKRLPKGTSKQPYKNVWFS